MKKKTLVSWSSGKDSAWALHKLRQSGEYEIAGLLTTMNAAFDRVAMHGTRRELVEAQAEAAGLPLITVPLPWPCSNEHYEAAMREACARAVADGVEVMAFGDLFLEDVRKYREDKLAGSGLTPVFPLWGLPTRELVREMLAAGVKARIVCVDPKKLPREFAGRDLDEALLNADAGGCRSVRGAGRVSHDRVCRADVSMGDFCRERRGGGEGRVCVRGCQKAGIREQGLAISH